MKRVVFGANPKEDGWHLYEPCFKIAGLIIKSVEQGVLEDEWAKLQQFFKGSVNAMKTVSFQTSTAIRVGAVLVFS